MAPIQWYIGCSGFHYKEWKELFYPKGLPQSRWFEYYAQHFNTLELNVTFYRFPTLQSLQNWHSKAPDEFVFSAKVPRTVTHYQKFKETENLISDFYAVLREGLGTKLGCVLFQLPPQFTYSEERLESILAQLDYSFTNVIEFRNESWWRGDVMQLLRQKGVSFCGVSFPNIAHDEAVITSPTAYYRFHGVPRLFYSEYEDAFLADKHSQLVRNTEVQKAYLYFNNTASLAALKNAASMQRLVKDS